MTLLLPESSLGVNFSSSSSVSDVSNPGTANESEFGAILTKASLKNDDHANLTLGEGQQESLVNSLDEGEVGFKLGVAHDNGLPIGFENPLGFIELSNGVSPATLGRDIEYLSLGLDSNFDVTSDLAYFGASSSKPLVHASEMHRPNDLLSSLVSTKNAVAQNFGISDISKQSGIPVNGAIFSNQGEVRVKNTLIPVEFPTALNTKTVSPPTFVESENLITPTINFGESAQGISGKYSISNGSQNLIHLTGSADSNFLSPEDKLTTLANSASLIRTVVGGKTIESDLDAVGLTARIESAGSLHPAISNSYSQSLSPASGSGAERVALPVTIQFGQPQWANMVAERSAMMAAQNIEFAELQLDPPELGPLQVKVSVSQDQQASVSFVANNQAVREALENSSQRLRELLEEQSIDLVDVDVSEHGGEGHGESEKEALDSANFTANSEHQGDESLIDEQTILAKYGIDSYA